MDALLPHVLRTNVSTAASSSSFSRERNAVIGGTPRVGSYVLPLTTILPHKPCSVILIRRSSLPSTQGLSTNGKVFALAQLAIARFPNPTGLEGLGSNYFQESSNSGVASIGSGLSGGRGQIIGSQLEGSNVDLAQEFTRLIVAQRGFSANARTITVADEILEELTNIIR